MITLTPRAARQVQAMQAELNAPQKRLRVLVESGGCSGFQYGMSFDEPKPDDTQLESEGVPLLIEGNDSPARLRWVRPAECIGHRFESAPPETAAGADVLSVRASTP